MAQSQDVGQKSFRREEKNLIDPNKISQKCERYLSRALGCPVEFIRAEALTQSTRVAPWRLDVRVNGDDRSYVLQVDTQDMVHEYRVLKAVESIPIPTPRAYGLDIEGKALGIACFLSDFIEGESLLAPMLRGETWAENLYLDSVCALQAVTDDDLGEVAQELDRTTAEEVMEEAYATLKSRSLLLGEVAYQKLRAGMPALPPVRFSNGDLWLENFIVKNGKLTGVIDFQQAGFSDPVFEFLLSFFVSPELKGRGIEERFCQRIGIDPSVLHWYHGLEFFDAWPRLLSTGKNFVHHTAESVERNLTNWLDSSQVG
jgi:aminoglycoside phosphotransferase (APT) family kinase protein